MTESSLNSPAWMNYYLPGAIILVALLHDFVSSISQPKHIRTIFRWLSSPFRNFLALEDLSEPVDFTPRWSKLKNRVLVSLASVAFFGWVGCLVFGVYMDDYVYTMKSMVQLASWVSTPCCCTRNMVDLGGRDFRAISL